MKYKSLGYVLFTALVFASMEPVSKLLSGRPDALSVTFVRFLIGSAMLLPGSLIKLRRGGARLRPADWGLLALEGILCVCVSMALLQVAVYRASSAAMIAVVFCTNSVLTVLFAALLLGERLSRTRLLAVALSMAGVLLCGGTARREDLPAILFALLAAAAMSLFTVLGKRNMARIPTDVQIGVSFPIGTALLALVLLCLGRPLFVPIRETAKDLGVVLYLGVAVTGLGYLSYFKAMEQSGAFMASLVFFIKPILAPLMSLLILGSISTGPLFLLTVVLIVAGSTLMLWERKEKT